MSKLENELAFQIRALQLPNCIRELQFHEPAKGEKKRRWRFDFAWNQPDIMLAVEVEGGLYVGGRHNRGAEMEKSFEKQYYALKQGWRVLQIGPNHIKSGEAIKWIESLISL